MNLIPSFLTRRAALSRRLLVVLLAVGLLLPLARGQTATSAVPGLISYQGKVTDASGNPIGASPSPVNRLVTFRIWSDSTNSGVGDLIYSEQQTITISDGEFSALIGQGVAVSDQPFGYDESGKGPPSLSVSSAAVFAGSDRYLGVTIDDGSAAADPEISPRQRMVTSAFAMRAKVAETLSTGSTDALTAADNGNVGVGVGAPSANLHVRGDIRSGAAGTQAPQVTLMASSDTQVALTMGYANTADAFSTAAEAGDSVIRTDNSGTLILQSGTAGPALTIDSANNVNVANVLSANLVHVHNDRPTHSYGGWLEWNKESNLGRTYLLNQKGDGTGGIVFGEVDTANSWAEHMFISGSGSVGIGTSDPGAKLNISDPTDPNILLQHTTGGGGTQMGVYMGSTSYGVSRQGDNLQLLSGSGNLTFGTASSPPMTLTSTGRLAIGNSAPAAPLAVRTGAATDPYLAAEFVSSNIDTILSLYVGKLHNGLTGGRLALLDIAGANPGHLAINDDASVWGKFGIGTDSPEVPIHIVTTSPRSISNYAYLNSSTTGTIASTQDVGVSFLAVGRVVTETEFNVVSDERVKVTEGISSGNEDLETLMQLEVTDYHYVDPVAHGTASEKKVIAQQVEAVYPAAVSTSTGFVPDIFTTASVADDWVQLATDLAVGDRVKLITRTSPETVREVLEVGSRGFRVDLPETVDEVFVYGREVDDLRSVDYDALSMLNVSATQQIKREKDAEIAALTTIVEDLLERVAELEAAAK